MQPVVLDLVLLRAVQTGELRIVPGRALMARVVQTPAQPNHRGLISIAGELIEAQLPKDVKPGEELRLVVRHVSAEKVQLSIADPHAVPASSPPPVEVPLPGGATLTINDEDSSAGGQNPDENPDAHTHTLSMRYQTPALGAVDLRFVLDAGSLKLAVTMPPGQPLELATQSADELRRALADRLRRGVELTIGPRHEPLDVYA